jgi:asparagine synthase (glutamine-hydrolysing)
MIFSVFYKDTARNVTSELMNSIMNNNEQKLEKQNFYISNNVGFAYKENFPNECCLSYDKKTSISLILQGCIYNFEELKKGIGIEDSSINSAGILIYLYKRYGESFIEKLNGKFAFILNDPKNNTVIWGRDRLGIESLYYLNDNEKILCSTSPLLILRHPEVEKKLNTDSVSQFLLYCYNPSFVTIFDGIQKLRPGHFMCSRNGNEKTKRYWKLSFADSNISDEENVKETLFGLLKQAVSLRIKQDEGPGVFLSGGMDSSSIVALTHSLTSQRIQTFSYRCPGVSFDESHYAKIVADNYKTQHHLTEYTSDNIASVAELVKFMDEPFCDVGINIATDLLGRTAQGKIQYVLTGDGGDELFAGHPVYLADPVGLFIDKIPKFLTAPVLWAGSKLHDSPQKKNFWVKWKRFSTSVQFPASLFSHRWRIYYNPGELVQLLNPDFFSPQVSNNLYQVILNINSEADGSNMLNKSLYSDYQTVVGFYLRRMDLIRHYGIEARFPLLDHKLVEYGARISSKLKIRNKSDTKYILKQTMKDVLPHSIVFRKDKLGHSVPLKNWMRDTSDIRHFLTDILSESRVKERGFFNSKFVSKLIDEHISMKQNHSHRLWALTVLELWLRENMDH